MGDEAIHARLCAHAWHKVTAKQMVQKYILCSSVVFVLIILMRFENTIVCLMFVCCEICPRFPHVCPT